MRPSARADRQGGAGPRHRLIVEASGGYERLLHERWTAAEVPVAIVHPKRVRAYARAIGRLAKTDRVEAHVLGPRAGPTCWAHVLGPRAGPTCWPATV